MFINVLKEIQFEIVLFLVGAYYTIEGLLLKYVNKCDLVTRSGDVAVITGGARGIGASVVEKLLKCDFHVIIGCRNTSAGAAMVRKIREEGVKSGSTTILLLDLASMESIYAFSKAVQQNRPKINLLINNAGIMTVPYKETEDGFETQWAVNYLGHFYLTHLLLKRMHENPNPTRIVNVSSCAHVAAREIDLSDVNMSKEFVSNAAYAQSKLAQILFTKYLDQRLRDIDSKVQVFAVHPGIVNTDILKSSLYRTLLFWILMILLRTPEEGARSVVYACLSKQLDNKSGAYISDCRIAKPNSRANNKELEKNLFEHSMNSLKIKSFGEIL